MVRGKRIETHHACWQFYFNSFFDSNHRSVQQFWLVFPLDDTHRGRRKCCTLYISLCAHLIFYAFGFLYCCMLIGPMTLNRFLFATIFQLPVVEVIQVHTVEFLYILFFSARILIFCVFLTALLSVTFHLHFMLIFKKYYILHSIVASYFCCFFGLLFLRNVQPIAVCTQIFLFSF